VRSLNGTTLITDRAGILNRWAEHFQRVLNQESKFDQSVLDEIPQWDTADALMDPIEPAEVQQAINQMSAGKSPGEDGLPVELCKTGGVHLQQKLLTIFKDIWHQHAVPQDFQNAVIVHIFKKKGDRSVCDDYRGISLLSIPGKILGTG